MSNVTETPLSPESKARQILHHIRAIGSLMEGFDFAPAATGRRTTRRGVFGVPLAFVESVAVALEASPTLAAAAGGPELAAMLRSEMNYLLTHTPILAELTLVQRGAAHTLSERRRLLNDKALRAYYLAKGLNRPSDAAVLVPHLAAMKKALGRARGPAVPPDNPPPSTLQAVRKSGGMP